ncbi:DUF4421 family protein [Roseivirga sp.]|uniref:DUF4421 family protein n=1 Tax=Roseivirga sp. TaxID=1964215 RepID=UPI003B51C49E
MSPAVNRRYLIIASTLCVCLSQSLFAQQDSLQQIQQEYITKINNYFNLSADLETDFETFELKGDNFRYDIRPNYSFINKVGIDYRAISVFYSFTPSLAVNEDENLKGSSTTSGIGFSWNTDRLINHVGTSRTEGFYLENSGDYLNDFVKGETPYIQFPELSIRSFRGFHAIKLNRNFSYSAFSAQMALQTKSAGSWAPGISYNFYKVENNTPTGQRSKNIEVLFNMPYYHTFVLDRKWYINLAVIPGIGLTHSRIKTPVNNQNFISHQNSLITRVSGLFGFGYNSPGFFGGVEGKIHQRFQNQASNAVKEEINGFAFRLFVGFHILAPKKINTLYDRVESKFF